MATVDDVKEVVQRFVDKQGHDRCWYYPELFNELALLLGITPTVDPALPSRQEFEKGCHRYQNEEYR